MRNWKSMKLLKAALLKGTASAVPQALYLQRGFSR
jgi:hypothetical protein